MPPKLKIGAVLTAGENNNKEQKRFTNGHKTFTSTEAKAMLETQSRENKTKANFERNMLNLTRSRNPLVGEATPREEDGISAPRLFPKYTATTSVEPQIEPNPLKRGDRTLERISSYQTMQDNMGGELEYLRSKIANKHMVMSTLTPSQATRF